MDIEPVEPGVVSSPVKLPKIAVVAVVIAFLLFLAALIQSRQEIWSLLVGLVPAFAGVTILRKRAWGAFGFALVEASQVVAAAILYMQGSAASFSQVVLITLVNLVWAGIFFLAGHAMLRSGTARGSAAPWILIVLFVTVPWMFVRLYVMPTASMENTLLLGDRLLVRTFALGKPAHGDLMVFQYPLDRKQTYLKRVIALPGDRVRMVSRVVSVNGKELKEPYTIHVFPSDPSRDNLPGDSTFPRSLNGNLAAAHAEMMEKHVTNGEVVVPPHKYFVLGDNRDNSLDSRDWGFVDVDDIIGKPVLIYSSETPVLGDPLNRGENKIRWSRFFKLL
jgi:signal peptidase I